MQKELEIAILAARKAGELQKKSLGKFKSLDYKSAFNLVTDVDKASEELIIRTILQTFPDHDFLAEEGGLSSLDLPPTQETETKQSKSVRKRWIIDPLDGTTNFAHSYPFFCVSIALEEASEVTLGVVYNSHSGRTFHGSKRPGRLL
jgi:myo-inositol-1(or 4)-monophosphatase